MGRRTGARRKKRSADLVDMKGSADVLRLLGDAGLDPARIARTVVQDPDAVGVMLVGSVAEGYQTAASDIDLLLLTLRSRHELDTSADMLIQSGSSLELLTYGQGVEVNTEIVCREDYDRVADTLDEVIGGLAFGGRMAKLPLFDSYTLKFLHRLRTGVVLEGADIVDQFREDFHSQSLPLYVSVMYLVFARESLEDARAVNPEIPGLVEYVCREVTERCLLALAAANGFTSQSRRFVMNWIAALPADHEHARLLRELRDSMLNRLMVPVGEKAGLVDECSRYFERVQEALSVDEVRRNVVDEIFSKISYAD